MKDNKQKTITDLFVSKPNTVRTRGDKLESGEKASKKPRIQEVQDDSDLDMSDYEK